MPFPRSELHHRRRAHDAVRKSRRSVLPWRVAWFHHCNKKDAPFGTAVRTAQIISEARDGRQSAAPGKETEIAGCEGARGALVEGVPVHSVRSMGYVASQEVVFGSMGQTLTIRHDSWDRTSYMPGVLLGIRSVGDRQGLIVGLENCGMEYAKLAVVALMVELPPCRQQLFLERDNLMTPTAPSGCRGIIGRSCIMRFRCIN